MLHIEHDRQAHRLLVSIEGQTAQLDYQLDGKVMHITDTRVPHPIDGHGVAAELMRTALELATENGWTVTPACSYAIAYMKNHPAEGPAAHLDELLDEALNETFPASDPPAVGGVD
jgi:predicted GNAT family acetyltransferase